MKPSLRNTIIVGDALEQLQRLPSASIDCVITSPPYFGLRDYQTDEQLGREVDVDRWVAALRGVMRELARVLKPSGSLWLNLGDFYSRHTRQGALPKSLVLGPERLLLAMHRDGWVVRNKVVWAKTNPLPASVDDRLTCSWEPLYLVVRSRRYFFDLDAIRVPHKSKRAGTATKVISGTRPTWAGLWAGNNSGLGRLQAAGRAGHVLGKNPGDVWRMSTASSRRGHHATYPEGLIERPILASCPERVCVRCGAPWTRAAAARSVGQLAVLGELSASCECAGRWRPGLVLDPFMGSGTTAVVAQRLGRDWLGIELNTDFVSVAEERIAAERDHGQARAA
jgi:site-specific DNA-methyltransferase (adenine-specific)